jgi:hypothetical protein
MRLLPVPILVAALLALGPAASADTFRGTTSQGRKITFSLKSGAESGLLRVSWRARCDGNGTSFRTVSVGRPKLDTPTRFDSTGKYVAKQDGGVRSTVRIAATGRRESKPRWTGTFAATVVVRKSGKTVDRCRLGRVAWSVTRD